MALKWASQTNRTAHEHTTPCQPQPIWTGTHFLLLYFFKCLIKDKIHGTCIWFFFSIFDLISFYLLMTSFVFYSRNPRFFFSFFLMNYHYPFIFIIIDLYILFYFFSNFAIFLVLFIYFIILGFIFI